MLSLGSFLSEQQFQCSICLDIFDNPVSTPCGHSYCMECIGEYWNGVKHYQCPLCKQNFKKKPELHINRTLREITEQFKNMMGATGAWGGLGKGELEGRGTEKGALMMEGYDSESMPSQDLNRRVSLRRYTLSGATDSRKLLQCAKHHRKLDLFCKSDGECICSECGDLDHQSHDIISAEKEWVASKIQINIAKTELQEMIGQRQRKVEEIKLSLEEIKMSAEREIQDSMRVFRALLRSIELSQAELLEAIEMSRCSAEHKAEGIIRELEMELTELRKRSAQLGKLAQTDNCISGLRSYTSHLNSFMPVKEWDGVSVTFELGTKSVYNSTCELLEHFQKQLRKLPEICLSASDLLAPLKAQPKMTNIQEYAVDVILDANTAHPRLILSEDRKKVRCGDRHRIVPNNPERFNCMVCVLGQDAITHGRHYWEVDVGGKTDWDLGVARHSINRKGRVTVSPINGYWFLSLRNKTNYAFGSDIPVYLPLKPKPSKIGVFVDYEKGQVSFFNVDAKLQMYTFSDTFCEAIYPFFSPCTNKSGMNDAALIITPVLRPV